MQASTYLHSVCLTDEKILDAALAILAREGYMGATTKKIADEAGINEVTLFRKFKSKENLIKEAKILSLKRSLEDMEKTFRLIESDDFETSIITLGKHISDSLDKKTNLILTSIGELQRLPACERMTPKFSKVLLDRLSTYFEDQMELGNIRDTDPKIVALSFLSFIFYTSFICKLNGQTPVDDSDRRLEEFMGIFINGVRAPEKSVSC